MVTKNLKIKQNCWIKKALIYPEVDTKELLKAKIISIQAYKNLPISLQILIEGQFLYSNISIYDVIASPDLKCFDNIKEMDYIECPDHKIDVYEIDIFNETFVSVKLKDTGIISAEYVCTVDFYRDNHQLHLLKNIYGGFLFIPNHKINFANIQEFPKLLKLV